MFCDQDDVWLPEKLQLFAHRMQALESQLGARTPIAVYSDVSIVDQDLAPMREVTELSLIDRTACDVASLMFGNVLTGCASMGNAALLELARPIPPDARVHDLWIAVLAAAAGRLDYINTPTILYRQHASNTIGAGLKRTGYGPFRKPHWWAAAIWREIGRRHKVMCCAQERLAERGVLKPVPALKRLAERRWPEFHLTALRIATAIAIPHRHLRALKARIMPTR